MAETTNYGLYVSNNRSEKFLDWSQKINGENDSNMTKIDTALGEKADKSQTKTATLLATGWVGTDKPYTQVVSVDGLGALQNGSAQLSKDVTPEQENEAVRVALKVTGQAEGQLTITAARDKPTMDIPIEITLLG